MGGEQAEGYLLWPWTCFRGISCSILLCSALGLFFPPSQGLSKVLTPIPVLKPSCLSSKHCHSTHLRARHGVRSRNPPRPQHQ